MRRVKDARVYGECEQCHEVRKWTNPNIEDIKWREKYVTDDEIRITEYICDECADDLSGGVI